MATRRCWHCDAITHMTFRGDPIRVGGTADLHVLQASFHCDECRWLQIATAERPGRDWQVNAKLWFDNHADITWWPAVGVDKPFEDVPEHIAEAAGEAHRCFSVGALRGAAALARAVIESSAKAKGITSGSLHAKIEALEQAGHVRPHIREAAHEVRHLGNEVAHGDFVEPIEREEAEEVLALMAEVLQEVFQSPARIARVRAAREAKKASQTGN